MLLLKIILQGRWICKLYIWGRNYSEPIGILWGTTENYGCGLGVTTSESSDSWFDNNNGVWRFSSFFICLAISFLNCCSEEKLWRLCVHYLVSCKDTGSDKLVNIVDHLAAKESGISHLVETKNRARRERISESIRRTKNGSQWTMMLRGYCLIRIEKKKLNK